MYNKLSIQHNSVRIFLCIIAFISVEYNENTPQSTALDHRHKPQKFLHNKLQTVNLGLANLVAEMQKTVNTVYIQTRHNSLVAEAIFICWTFESAILSSILIHSASTAAAIERPFPASRWRASTASMSNASC